MTLHAVEEIAEENLDILDIEHALLVGKVARIEKDDPRGTKYAVEGVTVDGQTPVGVVGRFTTARRYLIITVYGITGAEG